MTLHCTSKQLMGYSNVLNATTEEYYNVIPQWHKDLATKARTKLCVSDLNCSLILVSWSYVSSLVLVLGKP